VGQLVTKRSNEIKATMKTFSKKIKNKIDFQATRSKNLKDKCHHLLQGQRSFESNLINIRKRIKRIENTLGYVNTIHKV
jgi:hypothetical protein